MKCSSCKNKSIYFRNYEGRYYCKRHFIENIEKKVKKTIYKNKLIENDDLIACALSGGKDSSSNLFILNKLFEKNPKVKIIAISIDEGIKGYRDKALKKAEKLCKNLGIKHYVFSYKDEFGSTLDKMVKKDKTKSCTYCGVLRRYLLNKKARELGATKLATGHNLDDEAQTMIMNVLKGDVPRLVRCGAKPFLIRHKKFVVRIKPLIEIPENESELYAKLNKIDFYPKKCPYSASDALRVFTRKFLNELEKESPGIKYSLVRNTYKIVQILKKEVIKEKEMGTCKKCGEPSSQKVCKVCELMKR